MKIFLDTADTQLIQDGYNTGLIDGITTNPTLIMKSGRDPEEVYQQLIDLGIDDISMEVVGDFDEMYMEGLRLSRKFGKNATIKVPCTPAGLKVCKKLSRDLVNVNVTLIFSLVFAYKIGENYLTFLAWGVVIAGILQVIILYLSLLKEKIYIIFSLDFLRTQIKRFLNLFKIGRAHV